MRFEALVFLGCLVSLGSLLALLLFFMFGPSMLLFCVLFGGGSPLALPRRFCFVRLFPGPLNKLHSTRVSLDASSVNLISVEVLLRFLRFQCFAKRGSSGSGDFVVWSDT
ncbi:hypothetical protein QYF36_021085 [Acer negundo]|nr:hypothetical protein QYF36_021085 [Acer negundo]